MATDSTKPSRPNPLQVQYKAGQVIFKQGEPSEHLFILIRGKVVGYNGDQVTMELTRPRDLFGAVTTILGRTRNITAIAATDTVVLKISDQKLPELLTRSAELGAQLTRQLALQLDQLFVKYEQVCDQLQELTQLPDHQPPTPTTGPAAIFEPVGITANQPNTRITVMADGQTIFDYGKRLEKRTILQNGDEVELGGVMVRYSTDRPDPTTDEDQQVQIDPSHDAKLAINEMVTQIEDLFPDPPEIDGLSIRTSPQEPPFTLKPINADEQLLSWFYCRLHIFEQIDDMEKLRRGWLGQFEFTKRLRQELERQSKEARNMPQVSAESFQPEDSFFDLLDPPNRFEDDSDQPPIDEQGKPTQPGTRRIFAMAVRQRRLLLQRHILEQRMLDALAPCSAKEPLFKLFKVAGISSQKLFGFDCYQLLLQYTQARHEQAIVEARTGTTESGHDNRGLLARIRQQNGTEEQDPALRHQQIVELCKRELNAIEPVMIDCFWDVYQQAAQLLVSGRTSSYDMPALRAFLRYGLLGTSNCFISPNQARDILSECADAAVFEETPGALNLLYADEYIDVVAWAMICPSTDEQLELNPRLPRSKADRLRRAAIGAQHRIKLMEARAEEALQQAEQLEKRKEQINSSHAKIVGNGKTATARREALEVQAHRLHVRSVWCKKTAQRITGELIPDEIRAIEQANRLPEDEDHAFTAEQLATREANCIRRYCKLVNQLTEPFLPEQTRRHFRSDSPNRLDRGKLTFIMNHRRQLDPNVFHETILDSNERIRQCTIRFPPPMLILPTRGAIGYVARARMGKDPGCITVPSMVTNPALIDLIPNQVMADYRFNSSRAEAGADRIRSGTLANDYLQIRWEYSRKSREVQQRVGFNPDKNELANFRYHYQLYIDSAIGGGAKLYHKCPEVYELFLRYLELPEGAERVRPNH